jgi:tetratricopeptide (TPR) repeat protein
MSDDELREVVRHTALADTYSTQNNYTKAVEERRAGLAIQQRVYGPDHVLTLENRDMLARDLDAQGKHDEAEQEWRDVLAIQERVLEPDDRDLLNGRCRLAHHLWLHYNDAEAEAQCRAVLDVFQRVERARSRVEWEHRRSLVEILKDLGKLEEAEQEFCALLDEEEEEATRQRLADWDEEGEAKQESYAIVFGEREDRHSESDREMMGTLLQAQGKFAEAEWWFGSVVRDHDAWVKFYQAELNNHEWQLGPDDPETVKSRKTLASTLEHDPSCRQNLADVLIAQGKYAEAEAQYRVLLAKKPESELPSDTEPMGLGNRNALACALYAQAKYAEAEAEYRAVLATFQGVLGPEHPDTLDSHDKLAKALRAQGKNVEAEAEYRAVLAILDCMLVAEHPDSSQACYDSALCCYELALCLGAQGKKLESLLFARRALAGYQTTVGEGDPDLKDAKRLVNELNQPK